MDKFTKPWLGLVLCALALGPVAVAPLSAGRIHAQTAEPLSTTTMPLSPAIENLKWRWSLMHSNDDGDWEIYLHRYDDQNAPQIIQLTQNSVSDQNADFNPGAERIVFESDRDTTIPGVTNTEIYVMNADGSQQQRLTVNPGRDEMPRWSPNGDKILFSAAHDDGMEIYVMNADGSGRQRLTDLAGNDWLPSWSPDGQMIAWMRQGVNTGELWLMQADGSDQFRLVAPQLFLSAPVWSPDGRYIAFGYRPRLNEGNHIGIVNRDGSNLHEIRCTSPVAFEERAFPIWRPDSSGLYYTAYFSDSSNRLVETRVSGVMLLDGNCNGFGEIDAFSSLRIKIMTDIERADPWPPQSALLPVAPYSRLPHLLLQLTGKDTGRSGLANYDVEYQSVGSTTWRKGATYSPPLVLISPELAGPIAFRSRARDDAGNEEAWPVAATGEVQTIFYRARFQGTYTDQRGIPLANQAVAIGPMALEQGRTEVDGRFAVYIGEHRYMVNGKMKLAAATDLTRPLYVVPAANLIRNGDFEATTLTEWQSSGGLSPTLTTQPIYNGSRSLQLGASCANLCPPTDLPELLPPCLPSAIPGCLGPNNPDRPTYVLSPVMVLADPQDRLHFLGQSQQNELIYQRGYLTAPWESPIKLDDQSFFAAVNAAVEMNGDLQLVWGRNDGTLYYRRWTTSGWGATQPLGTGVDAKIAVDSQHRPHLLYLGTQPSPSQQQSLHYRQQHSDGSWGTPVDLALYPYASTSLSTLVHAIAVTADARVHLVWGKPIGEEWAQGFQLVYKTRSASGVWSGETALALGYTNLEDLRLFAAENTLHLFWIQDGNGYYATQTSDGNWSAPEMVGSFSDVALDAAGILHLVAAPGVNTDGTYRYRTPEAEWSDPAPLLRPSGKSFGDLAAGSANHLHTLWQEQVVYVYSRYQPVTTTADSEIYQVVTIPATMHRPTLSLIYALEGGATGASPLTVSISDGISTTVVFSTTEPHPWTLAWADLTPWQGATVTLTVALHQANGDLPVRAFVDDLALTAWESAAPQRFAPSQVAVGVSTTLVITGENFIATPTIALGTTPLPDVTLLDERTLRVTLPATLPPGRHPLWITNPGTTSPSYGGQIQVGNALYLPLVAR